MAVMSEEWTLLIHSGELISSVAQMLSPLSGGLLISRMHITRHLMGFGSLTNKTTQRILFR
ncbi:MAG: hypothetical protein EGQ02_17900 [Enterobacter cloacae]|nr:hypothetical protein [Enterobacter cloacae]